MGKTDRYLDSALAQADLYAGLAIWNAANSLANLALKQWWIALASGLLMCLSVVLLFVSIKTWMKEQSRAGGDPSLRNPAVRRDPVL